MDTPSFNQDISKWDTSSVTHMPMAFYMAKNIPDISGWDVSQVTDMASMFYHAYNFNGDLSGWDVRSVTQMSFMFMDSDLNMDLTNWKLNPNANYEYMLEGTTSMYKYNTPLVLTQALTHIPITKS
jgi:surface protein